MAERTVPVRLDKAVAQEVDEKVARAQAKRPGANLTRAGFVNELLARAVKNRRYLRALGAS